MEWAIISKIHIESPVWAICLQCNRVKYIKPTRWVGQDRKVKCRKCRKFMIPSDLFAERFANAGLSLLRSESALPPEELMNAAAEFLSDKEKFADFIYLWKLAIVYTRFINVILTDLRILCGVLYSHITESKEIKGRFENEESFWNMYSGVLQNYEMLNNAVNEYFGPLREGVSEMEIPREIAGVITRLYSRYSRVSLRNSSFEDYTDACLLTSALRYLLERCPPPFSRIEYELTLNVYGLDTGSFRETLSSEEINSFYVGYKPFDGDEKTEQMDEKTEQMDEKSEQMDEKSEQMDEKTDIFGEYDSFAVGKSKNKFQAAYKTGLKPPDSLSGPFNTLIRKREVIKFLIKGKNKNQRKTFWDSDKFKNLPDGIRLLYKNELNKYGRASERELKLALKYNNGEIARFLKKEEKYRREMNTENLPPKFIDVAAPSVSEISLSDYKYLTIKALKQYCYFTKQYINERLNQMPGSFDDLISQAYTNAKQRDPNTKYTHSKFQKRPENAMTELLGNKGNYCHPAIYHLGNAYKAFGRTIEKLEDFRSLIFPAPNSSTGFEDIAPILCFTYSVPRHLMNYLRAKWDISDANWVRNLIVGFRRKLDGTLPPYMQIESQTAWMDELYNELLPKASNDEEIKILNYYYRRRLLHIFSDRNGPDLSCILPKPLIPHYKKLSDNIPRDLFERYEKFLLNPEPERVKSALVSKITEIEGKLENMTDGSRSYSNTKTFLNKLNAINNSFDYLSEFLPYTLIGSRYEKSLAKILSEHIGGFSRLFTAIRSILPHALAEQYPDATAHLESALSIDTALTPPFRSKKSKKHIKKYLPVDLLRPKYGIVRKSDPHSSDYLPYNLSSTTRNYSESVTTRFRAGKPIWVGIPLFTDSVLETGIKTGNLMKKRTLWNRIFPTPKIIYALNHGAVVNSIQLLPPDGPSGKIIADVSLSSESRAAFKHRTAYRKKLDAHNFQIKTGKFLGTDFNRLGRFMLATASDGVPHNLWESPFMDVLGEISDRIQFWTHTEIPRNQAKLSRLSPESPQYGRIKAQITLLHKKISNLRKFCRIYVPELLAYIAEKSGAKYIAWDGIEGITHRGKSGGLAEAITGMPKSREIFEFFMELMEDSGLGGVEVKIIPPPPS